MILDKTPQAPAVADAIIIGTKAVHQPRQGGTHPFPILHLMVDRKELHLRPEGQRLQLVLHQVVINIRTLSRRRQLRKQQGASSRSRKHGQIGRNHPRLVISLP